MINRRVPVDLASADSVLGWESDFVWPVSLLNTRCVAFDIEQRFMLGVEDLHADAADLAIHAGRLLGELLLAADSVKLVQSARKSGIELVGGPPVVRCLLDEAKELPFTEYSMLPKQVVKYVKLREMTRALSWSKGMSCFGALFKPDVMAISHNALLRSEAANTDLCVGFRHGFDMMDRVAIRFEKSITTKMEQWRNTVSDVRNFVSQILMESGGLDSSLLAKASAYIEMVVEPILWNSVYQLETARHINNLPDNIWIASAGQPKIRALSLEVKRRGGRVSGFDHAGAAGLMADNYSLLNAELIIANEFWASTAQVADMVRANTKLAPFSVFNNAIINAGSGDPTFGSHGKICPSNRRFSTPNVLYVVGAFDGARRRVPPSLTDPVKLVWWTEVAKKIMALPVEFKMQVHPGGSLRGARNPLHNLVPTSKERFEQVVAWADVIVIDVTQSTTLTASLCSDKHLVLVDYGRNEMLDPVRDMARRRAAIINADFDERGVPIIDSSVLRDAILGSPVSLDGSEFRTLYAGQYV